MSRCGFYDFRETEIWRRLAKNTQLSTLLTGCVPDRVSKNDLAEALVMKLVLENEMKLNPKFIEDQSNIT